MNVRENIEAAGLAPLKIRRVDAIRVALPLTKPMNMAGVRIETADNVLVRIETADGALGWGEATVAPTMTGELAEGIVAAVNYLAPLVVGRDLADHAAIMRRCLAAAHGNGGAKSAIDMALLDLVGRRTGASTTDLLGGALRGHVPSMWLLGNASVADDIAEARAKQKEGFRLFKLKVGVKPVAEEIEAALTVRRELGDGVQLCADANTGFDTARARQYLQAVAGVDLLYLEQPVPAEDMAGMAALSALGAAPICADEGIMGTPEILAHAAAHAMQGINLKLMKAGGPRAAVRVAALCEALGLSLTVAGKVAESSISASNTLAVAAAVHNVDWGLNLTHIYLAHDLAKTPVALTDGGFDVPRGPGNGVEVDEAAVERFRIR